MDSSPCLSKFFIHLYIIFIIFMFSNLKAGTDEKQLFLQCICLLRSLFLIDNQVSDFNLICETYLTFYHYIHKTLYIL